MAYTKRFIGKHTVDFLTGLPVGNTMSATVRRQNLLDLKLHNLRDTSIHLLG